jgi:hypothetical protein
MTVYELLKDKYAEELEDGMEIVVTEYMTQTIFDMFDDSAAELYGERDVYSYTFYPSRNPNEADALYIEIAGEWNKGAR